MPKRARKYEKIKEQINSIGWIAAGSVMTLYRTCGKQGCACANDKQARHGPYLVWTRKVDGKTITRTLSVNQARACRRAIESLQKLEAIIAEMKLVSAQAIEDESGDASS